MTSFRKKKENRNSLLCDGSNHLKTLGGVLEIREWVNGEKEPYPKETSGRRNFDLVTSLCTRGSGRGQGKGRKKTEETSLVR